MLEKLYECLIYTLIRGYINKGYNYLPCIIDCKRCFDDYSNCWLYKILKIFI